MMRKVGKSPRSSEFGGSPISAKSLKGEIKDRHLN